GGRPGGVGHGNGRGVHGVLGWIVTAPRRTRGRPLGRIVRTPASCAQWRDKTAKWPRVEMIWTQMAAHWHVSVGNATPSPSSAMHGFFVSFCKTAPGRRPRRDVARRPCSERDRRPQAQRALRRQGGKAVGERAVPVVAVEQVV